MIILEGIFQMKRYFFWVFTLLILPLSIQGKLAEITPLETTAKFKEIMEYHAVYKEFSPEIVKRTLLNYLEELDPTKSYFIEPDIHQWLEPSDTLIKQIQTDFDKGNYRTFGAINTAFA